MRKYITLTEGCELRWNKEWLKVADLRQVSKTPIENNWKRQVNAICNFENEIYITIMTDQSGAYHWHVVHTAIDGPIVHKSGSFRAPLKDGSKFSHDHSGCIADLQNQINQALGDLLVSWIVNYLPKQED